jgi:hypothetical protein
LFNQKVLSRDVNSPPEFRLERKGGEPRRTLSLSPPELEKPFASPPFRPETREISLGEHFRRDFAELLRGFFRREFAELSRGFFAESSPSFHGVFSPRFRRDSPRLAGLFRRRRFYGFFLEIFKNKVLKIMI